ncbi:hypothetical protein R0135_01225 [Congregibacter variabilis]|uniref:LemA protein n=1 Tax=Congregibacter variabilis TaxID=3081200 RepID=A0ABZ0I2T0_9GAMM|nr:hypothetical protein R0135_01225 [Congregibacter sp. IMCC43200]
MKLSQLNDYVQTLATIGAIAGLLLVAYEIRQSTRIALAESYRDGNLNSVNMLLIGLESGISGPLIKAETQPEALTPEEKMAVSVWLKSHLRAFANEYSQIDALGVNLEEERRLYDQHVERAVPVIFSSAWSRAWFYQEGASMVPRVSEVVGRVLEKHPPKNRTDVFKQIDEMATTIE